MKGNIRTANFWISKLDKNGKVLEQLVATNVVCTEHEGKVWNEQDKLGRALQIAQGKKGVAITGWVIKKSEVNMKDFYGQTSYELF
jgi:hypothetical protein